MSIVQLESAYRASASSQEFNLAVSAYNSLVQGQSTSHGLLASSGVQLREAKLAQPAWRVCVSIPKWAVVAYAWYVIVEGGATAAVGAFLDVTIFGLPAGAVLNAIGIGKTITGSALLYWTDHTGWPKQIACVGW